MTELTPTTIYFNSADGKNTVSGWIYIPDMTPIAVVQISHGMCEYLARYEPFIQDLLELGFVVCGHDHIGHGASSRPEEYGYFGAKNGCQNLVEDLHTMTMMVKRAYPDLPFFLFGHSMGSFIARLYSAKYNDCLTGAIFCGTGGPDPMAAMGIVACSITSLFCGRMYRSKKLDQLAFGKFNRKIENPRTSKDWLTRKPEIVDRYLADPQCTFLFTASGYKDLSKLSFSANKKSWFRGIDPDLPILLVAGEADPVGNYGIGVKEVYQNLKTAGVRDVSLKLYPDARHELVNERNYQTVFSDLTNWLFDHI